MEGTFLSPFFDLLRAQLDGWEGSFLGEIVGLKQNWENRR